MLILFEDASYKITPRFSWGKSLAVKVSPVTRRRGRVISNLMVQGVYSNDEYTDDCVTCSGVYFELQIAEKA